MRVTYALDFDGVLCDSSRECMVTSYVAYRRLIHGVAAGADEIPASWQTTFTRWRYLARRACEYKQIWDLIVAGGEVSDEAFGALGADPGESREYQDLFYATRAEWLERDASSWLAHNPLYPGVAAMLRRWLAEGRAAIVSAKDSRSILTILEHAGVDIRQDLVLGMDGGDKPEHYRQILAWWAGAPVVAIDDNLENLRYARTAGLRPRLARWGYVSPETLRQVTDERIPALSLEEFLRLD